MDDLAEDYGNIYADDNNEKILKDIQHLCEVVKTKEIVTFKIISINKLGFKVKVLGFCSFVYFKNMPWTYEREMIWKIITPSLYPLKFKCIITEINYNNNSIKLDAKISQLKVPTLTENKEYNGLIISESSKNIFIDIGYHFRWKFGSLQGYLHKTSINDYNSRTEFKVGNEIKVKYLLKKEYGLLKFDFDDVVYNQNRLKFEEEANKFIGKIIEVKVLENDGKLLLWYNDKYNVFASFNPHCYNNLPLIKQMRSLLKENEMIKCEVLKAHYKDNLLILRWKFTTADVNRINDIIDDESLVHLNYSAAKNEEDIKQGYVTNNISENIDTDIVSKDDLVV